MLTFKGNEHAGIVKIRMSTQDFGESLREQKEPRHNNFQTNVSWERLGADASRLFSVATDKFDIMLLCRDSKGLAKRI
jgi:hypothetical protein